MLLATVCAFYEVLINVVTRKYSAHVYSLCLVCKRWQSSSQYFITVAVLRWGQGAQAPKSCPGPPNFVRVI